MFYAEFYNTDGQVEKGVFLSIDEFVPYYQQGWRGTDTINELAESASNKDDDEPYQIPCSHCGKPTTFDSSYGDLCYRCIRADNE